MTRGCGLGACACSVVMMLADEAFCEEQTEDKDKSKQDEIDRKEFYRLKWWMEHTKRQYTKLIELLIDEISEEKRLEIMEKLGRNCAKSIGWAKKYKGNPEAFFGFMNSHQGEVFDYNKGKGVITIVTKERDCDCRMVDSKKMPPYYCNCSKGWQKYTYEVILGKAVDVEVKESVLFGQKRCVFEITLGDKLPV